MKIRTSTIQARSVFTFLLTLSFLIPTLSFGDMIKHTDIVFAKDAERELLLDLYLPDGRSKAKLIIWLHGGVWRFGGKEDTEVLSVVDHGFAFASIAFRNSTEAVFPTQIHDIKAAIRYLRANAELYGFDATNIAIWGYSSGAHLAALTGTTNGNLELEGGLGEFRDVSSDVQAIIGFSGPANLHSILHQSTEHGVSVRAPGMQDFLGAAVDDPAIKSLVDLASPALQVSDNSPPILIMHGVQDNQVPINQSIELQLAYEQAGRHVESEWIAEAQHTSGEYFTSPYIEQVVDFLNRVL